MTARIIELPQSMYRQTLSLYSQWRILWYCYNPKESKAHGVEIEKKVIINDDKAFEVGKIGVDIHLKRFSKTMKASKQ